MKDFAVNYEGDDIVAYNKLLFETFPQTLFDPGYLASNSLLNINNVKVSHGRGAIYHFEYKGIDLVLRHYHRGGIPAKLIDDKYFWLTLEKSRAMQEIEMLSTLHEAKLPVPKPAAVRIHKNKFTYQADIITVLIPNAKTLSSILFHTVLANEAWCRVGRVIKNFHNQNCYHADLNAHNIMLKNEGSSVYLIDFDKSKIKTSSEKWKVKNLQRLKRSLEKLVKNNKGFNYSTADFDSLMQGYAAL
ncbi:MAG: 3-deoxy-D-manno-octulosonic acid kinase [Gammaproteobacteria bacterium]